MNSLYAEIKSKRQKHFLSKTEIGILDEKAWLNIRHDPFETEVTSNKMFQPYEEILLIH